MSPGAAAGGASTSSGENAAGACSGAHLATLMSRALLHCCHCRFIPAVTLALTASQINVLEVRTMDRARVARDIRRLFEDEVVEPIHGLPPVLTEEQSASLADLPEAAMLREMTPHICKILESSDAADLDDPLVPRVWNSEELSWLAPEDETDPRRQKRPDMFVAPAAFVLERDASKAGIQGSGPGYRFGKVLSRLHADSCVWQLLEGKKGKNAFTDDEVADPIEYGTYVKGVCVVLLFNAREFMLYRSVDGQPKAMKVGLWTTPGAAQAIKTFFERGRSPPQLLSLLRSALLAGRCVLKFTGTLATGRTCLLGAGGSGHVFRVVNAVGSFDSAAGAAATTSTGGHLTRGSLTPDLALKLVLDPAQSDRSHRHVLDEWQQQLHAAEGHAPVIAPVSGSFVKLEGGYGYLLRDVGTPVERTAANFTAAFFALRALHRHGWCHGDARLPNLLDVHGSFRWIDMAFSHPYSATGASADACTLAASLTSCSMSEASPSILALLADVSSESSDADLRTLSEMLWDWAQAYHRDRAALAALSLSGSPCSTSGAGSAAGVSA